MTGTMHVADDQGDTTHTWDTADPTTIQEIEELFPGGPDDRATGLPPDRRRRRRTATPGHLEPRGAHRAVRRPPTGRRLARWS
jgi:hypothetical protein